jgi:hypothetical protein
MGVDGWGGRVSEEEMGNWESEHDNNDNKRTYHGEEKIESTGANGKVGIA